MIAVVTQPEIGSGKTAAVCKTCRLDIHLATRRLRWWQAAAAKPEARCHYYHSFFIYTHPANGLLRQLPHNTACTESNRH